MRTTLYENIYSKIANDITSGRLRAGQKLPSVRQYADSEGISKNTVICAYNLLLSEGFVTSVEKRGYFVSTFDLRQDKVRPVETRKEKPCSEQETLIDLSSNMIDSSLFPFDTLRRLYREALSGSQGDILEKSGPFTGESCLKKAISDHLYETRSIICDEDDIIIGNGTANHLQMITRLFAKSPTVFMESPCYTNTLRLMEGLGIKPVQLVLDSQGIDMTVLSEKSEAKDDVQILHISPSHQYPTGIITSAPRRMSLISWASMRDNRYIIEDDYDSDFRYIGHPIPALKSLDRAERVIYLGTFSRTLTPAVRISYMILPKSLRKTFDSLFSYYPCPVSRIDQTVLSRFMNEGCYSRHIRRMKRIYRERRDLMIKSIEGLAVSGHDAGLHFVVGLENDEDEVKKELLQRKILADTTGDGHLIVGYAHLSEDQIISSAKAITEVGRKKPSHQ